MLFRIGCGQAAWIDRDVRLPPDNAHQCVHPEVPTGSLCGTPPPPRCSPIRSPAISPRLLGNPTGCRPLAVFLNPPSSPPTQRVGTQPPHPKVEDSLLQRHRPTYTRTYQPAYSFSLNGAPPPPPHPPLFPRTQAADRDPGRQSLAAVLQVQCSFVGPSLYHSTKCRSECNAVGRTHQWPSVRRWPPPWSSAQYWEVRDRCTHLAQCTADSGAYLPERVPGCFPQKGGAATRLKVGAPAHHRPSWCFRSQGVLLG